MKKCTIQYNIQYSIMVFSDSYYLFRKHKLRIGGRERCGFLLCLMFMFYFFLCFLLYSFVYVQQNNLLSYRLSHKPPAQITRIKQIQPLKPVYISVYYCCTGKLQSWMILYYVISSQLRAQSVHLSVHDVSLYSFSRVLSYNFPSVILLYTVVYIHTAHTSSRIVAT